ncbi:MAG: hypothetical protein Ta2A_01870 [Treponemataceae bacterium]|nr:MAG: hypothetical protein Ta2A_01870 [Treponemataceae bacterium]
MKKVFVFLFGFIFSMNIGAFEFSLGKVVVEIGDDWTPTIGGVCFTATDNGIDMNYLIPIDSESGADAGRITMSVSRSDEANSWYMPDCTIGFYYDLTDYLYTGIETAWNVIEGDMRFSVRPMANFKMGEHALLKGWYALENLSSGSSPKNDLFVEMSFMWKI